MEKVAGTTELLADGRLYELAEKVQGLTALLPDYGFQASESAAGTSFSGIVGGVYDQHQLHPFQQKLYGNIAKHETYDQITPHFQKPRQIIFSPGNRKQNEQNRNK